MPVPDTSASGGYLRPLTDPSPLQGRALNRFFQAFVVGITGMNPKTVRPSWQAEPPDIPDAGEAWAAIQTNTIDADMFPPVIHDAEGDGADTLKRQELISILASFYDLGTDGLADDYAAILRDGLSIDQNLESLFLANMGLNSVGSLVTVPTLVKTRWLYRVDFPFKVVRQVDRVYRVQNVRSIDGTLVTSDGDVLDISVPPNP